MDKYKLGWILTYLLFALVLILSVLGFWAMVVGIGKLLQ